MTGNDMNGSDKLCGDKRLRIIEAAVIVFSRKGFHRAKVEEIAEVAGVGKGTVYEYFKSKKELFLEMVLYIHQKYEAIVRQKLLGVTTFRQKLQEFFRVSMDFLRRHKEMALILLVDHPPVDEDANLLILRKKLQQVMKVSKMVEEAVEREEIRPVNAKAVAQIILGSLAMVGSQVIFDEEENGSDSKKLEQDVIDIILHGLTAV